MFKQLTVLLSQYPEIKLAILFGSLATGNARPDSDVDLALLAEAPLTSGFKLQLIQTIGAEFDRPVDIVDLFHAPEPILGQILKGIRLYGEYHLCQTVNPAFIEYRRLSSDSSEDTDREAQ